VESYGWDCDDEGLFFYGQPSAGNKSAHTYWHGYVSPTNPFKPSGFIGSCQFPQITAGGLDDSWQHGKDLYGVYHDLLHFLPDDISEAVSFRVTQNQITSQVAGMLINGMFETQDNIRLLVEVKSYSYIPQTLTKHICSLVGSTLWSQPTLAMLLQQSTTMRRALRIGMPT
jgi:acid phosphatase